MTITRVSIVVAAILVLLPCGLLADGSQTGTIDGRVLDTEGQPLPGVLVRLTSALGEKTATTGADGSFRFGLLGPGDYVLSASLEGLASTEISAPLDAGGRRTIDLTLRASTAEAITVTADAVLVDPYVIGSSARVEAEVAEELSFRNRHYQSAVEVLPGVVHDATSRGQGDVKFAVNGGQDTEVAGFVDGVDISFSRFNGSPRLFLPTTALQEFGLDSAGFATEYGRVVGGISNAVVKSGTNEFHGSFLYIPQNQKWRAPYDAIDIPREDDIIDSFETSVGGPIYRDKAWFFAAYAETDTNQLDRFPDGSAVNVGFQNEVKVGKVTFQPSARHNIALLGIDSPVHKNHIEPNSGDRFTPCTCDLGGEVLTVNWGFSITSSLFLEVKAADQENSLLRENAVSRTLTPGASPDSPMGNNFSYQDRGSGLLHNTIGQPAGTGFLIIPRDQANGSLSLFHGSHELKLGADYQDVEMQTLNEIGKRYFGLGYDENLIGGFRTPQVLDVFDPSQVIATTSDVVSVYAPGSLGPDGALEPVCRSAARRAEARERDRRGGRLLHQVGAAAGAGVRRRRHRPAPAQGLRRPLLPDHQPGLRERGVRPAAQRQKPLQRIQLELGHPALRHFRATRRPRPQQLHPGHRSLLQGRGDDRHRVAVRRQLGVRGAGYLVGAR